MTQTLRTSPVSLLPIGITSLAIQPTADGCYLLDRPDGVILAQIDAHEHRAGVWHIELYEDGQEHEHTGTLATAIRWAEQGIAELDHIAKYGEMPDYVTIPAKPWPATRTTTALAEALEAVAASLRAFDVVLPSGTAVSLDIHVMGGFSTSKAENDADKLRIVDTLIAGLALPAGVDRSPRNPDKHYGTPHKTRGGSVHCGGLDVDIVAIVDRDPVTLAARVAELEAQLAAAQGGAR